MTSLGSRAYSFAAGSLLANMEAHLTYAFQPIVNVHTGEVYGFEALLREYEALGFAAIPDVFAAVERNGIVVETELMLQELAVEQFRTFSSDAAARLFFNLNNTLLSEPHYQPAATRDILERHGLRGHRFCIELSEGQMLRVPGSLALLTHGWTDRPLIALDDFGTGYSGLRLLAESKPDIIKVDRFFVAGVDARPERRLFLNEIVNLAHSLGSIVIAEGIETEGEFRVCRDVGCDYVQGFFICRPTTDHASLAQHYPLVEAINRRNRRARSDASTDIRGHLDTVEPLPLDAPVTKLLDAFQHDKKRSFFPIVSGRGEPVGIVHEEGLKSLIYSQFGRDLLVNRVRPRKITDFVTPCPVFDVDSGIDRILNAIVQRPDDHAILIVEHGAYIGLLDARGIIRTMHDRMVAMASDQNPLTKLPGNVMVTDFMVELLEAPRAPTLFVHFDFDNFKPFNDRFGFRQGDRAIAMFADLMRSRLGAPDVFLGHIGGDDFFLGAHGSIANDIVTRLPAFVAQFASDVESFYDGASRRAGYTGAHDRNGLPYQVPLLAVSCGVFLIETESVGLSMDVASATLARLKKAAKLSASKLAIERIGGTHPGAPNAI